MEPAKYYPIEIKSRFEFDDLVYPVKCMVEQDNAGSYYPVWYVGVAFRLASICTNKHGDIVYLSEHKWGCENKHLALDVDAYHTLEDAEHQVELRNRHYIKG